jgi:hypothetical protein
MIRRGRIDWSACVSGRPNWIRTSPGRRTRRPAASSISMQRSSASCPPQCASGLPRGRHQAAHRRAEKRARQWLLPRCAAPLRWQKVDCRGPGDAGTGHRRARLDRTAFRRVPGGRRRRLRPGPGVDLPRAGRCLRSQTVVHGAIAQRWNGRLQDQSRIPAGMPGARADALRTRVLCVQIPAAGRLVRRRQRDRQRLCCEV